MFKDIDYLKSLVIIADRVNFSKKSCNVKLQL